MSIKNLFHGLFGHERNTGYKRKQNGMMSPHRNVITPHVGSISAANLIWALILHRTREPLKGALRWEPILPNTRDLPRIGDPSVPWIPVPKERHPPKKPL